MSRALPVAATAGALAAALVLAPLQVSPAAAAGELQLSLDGTSWSSTLGAPVFRGGDALVPGSSIDGALFVRNATAEPAWVRVGVSGLTVTSAEFAVSMSLTTIGTTTDNASGSTSRLSAGDILCNDFLRRSAPIPAGGIVRIDASLSFSANVGGTTAQNEAAAVAFIAELSDVDLNALGVPLCSNEMIVGPVEGGPGGTRGPGGSGGPGPAEGSSGGGHGGGTPAAGSSAAAAGGSGGGGGASAGSVGGGGATVTESIDGGTLGIGAVASAETPFNTVQWWEEYAILVLLGATLIGAIAALQAQRQRIRRNERMGSRR